MTEKKLNETRVKLYKATPTKLQLVDELFNLIRHCFGGKIEVNGIRFDSTFRIRELSVNLIEVLPNDVAKVMVHWHPDYNISPRTDPYCSAYILDDEEIQTIIKHIKEIKEYYNSHRPK